MNYILRAGFFYSQFWNENGQNVKFARVFLFRIPISEWTERHSIHSAPRGRMNRILRMKIQDGGRRDERCGFKYVSTGEIKGILW